MDKPLKARDLCNIIKTCKNSGVSRLAYAGVTLEFFNSDSQRNVELNSIPQLAGQPNTQSFDQGVAKPQSQVLEPDDERALLLIDHPEDFENLMIDEDLERSRKHLNEVNHDEQDDSGIRANLQ